MNFVVIRRMGGFYNVFDDDAIVLNYLCDYKVKDNRCGFPISALNKVINILEINKVSYIVREAGIKLKKNFNHGNKYDKILVKGRDKYNKDIIVNKIVSIINSLSYDRQIILLDEIEEYMDGL